MALLVYVTDRCRETALKHSLSKELDRFRERVVAAQSVSYFDPFPPPYMVKKKFAGDQARLIAERQTVEDHAVIIFWEILIRGDRAYDSQFSKDPIEYGTRNYSGLLNDAILKEFVEKETTSKPSPAKPTLNPVEYGFLYDVFAHHQGDHLGEVICETAEWVERVADPKVQYQLTHFNQPCLSSLKSEPGLHFMPVDGKEGWGILFRRLDNVVMFVGLTMGDPPEYLEKLRQKYGAIPEPGNASSLLRSSRRAYPALILTDEELWLQLQKETLANMALSPEESQVLASARSPDGAFPLFINGRAGSGKSTILQYLFADLLFHYLTNEDARKIAPPIYLTVNGELLRVARSFIERLLKSGAIFHHVPNREKLLAESRELLDQSFCEFQSLLISLLPFDVRTERFAKANRIDYPRFRRMWKDRFGKEAKAVRTFGPDLSWHVIRSYIKGLSSDSFLDPEDYTQLPENQITVTKQTYQLVYDRVWTGWYQRTAEGNHLWDDQDLARYIIDHDLVKPVYPAVFCDESQDFTRLELEILLRLSLFSDRSVPASVVARVPFAFAGDQFQTLNPTGFQWESIKASFVEKFIFALDPARKSGRTDLNYCELAYNYRSTHKIVRFSNLIQAFRAFLFDLRGLRPQTAWTEEDQAHPVTWFRTNDGEFWKRFKEREDIIVIVPCGEGEESDFVQNDPVLKLHIRLEDGVPQNVLSTSRAKGREYQIVVTYGFGDSEDAKTVQACSDDESVRTNIDQSLPIQYFINRLYVAVSRPKARLFIVDTDAGFDRLWRFAQDPDVEDAMLLKIKRGIETWQNSVEGMTMGRSKEAIEDIVNNLEANAKGFEQDGLARRDPFLLRQASFAYRSAGDMAKYAECRARALEAEGEFIEAGKAFFENGFAIPEGIQCLWRAGRPGWEELLTRGSSDARVPNEIEFQATELICQKQSDPSQILAFLRRLAETMQTREFQESALVDSTWRDALTEIIRKTQKLFPETIPDNFWIDAAACLRKLDSRQLRAADSVAAPMYYMAGDFASAVERWERADETNSKDYVRAKAFVEPYPKKLISLQRLGANSDIEEAYRQNPGVPLDLESMGIIAEALRIEGNLFGAFDLAWKVKKSVTLLAIASQAKQSGQVPLAKSAIHATVQSLVFQQSWETLLNFISSLELRLDKSSEEGSLQDLVETESDNLQLSLIRALARSDSLPNLAIHTQRQFSDFLRRVLKVKNAKWRGKVSIAEAGAAIERAGRFTDAISFYEAASKEEVNTGESQLCAVRWLVCKSRQADYERDQGNKKKVEEIAAEIAAIRKTWQLSSDTLLPQYPELDPLEQPRIDVVAPAANQTDLRETMSPTTPAHSLKVAESSVSTQFGDYSSSIGPYRIEISRKLAKINITHQESMEMAYIRASDQKCGGEVNFNATSDDTQFCEQWNLEVKMEKVNSTEVRISFNDFNFTALIRF